MNTISKIILIIVLITSSISGFSQEAFDIKKFNFEKEKILNVIINSPQFDSIYHSKKVVFIETELLSKYTPLKLRRGKCKVKIKSKGEIKTNEEYVDLGDFTCDPNNMIRVRVQIGNSVKHRILNLVLEKNDGEWKISNHLIMDN